MQVKELKNEGLSYELEVKVGKDELEKQTDDRLKEYAKTLKVPGFRPGKVPLNVVKQRYGRSVMGEVLEKTVNDTSLKAMEEKGLKPATQPKIEVKDYDEGKDLVYTMAVEVIPKIDIMDLKTIKLEKPVCEPTDEAVQEALDNIAQHNRATQPVETKRATKEGDVVKMDFHGRTADDNVAHEGMHAHGHQLELGSGQFIPGFEEQLIGKKAGDDVEVTVDFPKEYHASELAGRQAIFDVKIHEILEYTDSKLDDEFAKKLGLDSLDALKDAIKTQIQSEYDNLSKMKLKRALLDILDTEHDSEVPAGMKEMELGNIKQQISIENPEQVKDGELKLSDEEAEELEAIAERRVKLGILLSEIGSTNNIQVSDQEIQRAVIQEAQKYPGQEAQVFEYYKSNRNALDALRAPVFEDKVIDFITDLADVKEKKVSLEELTKEDEESYLSQKSDSKKKSSSKKSSSGSTAKKSSSKKSTTTKKTTAKKGSSSAAKSSTAKKKTAESSK